VRRNFKHEDKSDTHNIKLYISSFKP